MNDREAFHRAKEIFVAACELPATDRLTYLDRACKENPALRARVEALLAVEETTILETGAASGRLVRPDVIAGYRLISRIGDGGMGEVWEAEQEGSLTRRVAIKLVKWGMDSEQVVARFESERQSLAMMDHPSIAKVFEAGTTDHGRPYFAMELVRGVPITDYCDSRGLSVRDRLRLFIQVCHGVQHAHQKGIIHRDLKPANILITETDGEVAPKIIDFGIAKAIDKKRTERTIFTEIGQWFGTPEYMSPEQAGFAELDVDTRADVYSLGVVLYELLVGTLPIDQSELREASFEEMLRRIREVEPARPSTLAESADDRNPTIARNRRTSVAGLVRLLRGDLDWLTMKALEKDRDRRYASVAELAGEMMRYLRHEPVHAGPPSAWYRLRKFVRRNRVAVAAAAVVVAALVAGLAVAATGLVRARRSEEAAIAQADKARRVAVFLQSMIDTMDPTARSIESRPVRDLLEESAAELAVIFPDDPATRARLLETIGRVSTRYGYFDLAERVLADALALQRQVLGDDHSEVAGTLHTLGWQAWFAGDYGAAVAAMDEAAGIFERSRGTTHELTIESVGSLGFFLSEAGDHQRARRVLERAFELATSGDAPNPLVTANISNWLASRYLLDGRTEEAGPLFERAVEIRAREQGRNNSSYAWAVNDLGRYHLAARRYGAARDCIEEALEIQRKALGANHPAVAIALGNLGFAVLGEGDPAGAQPMFEGAIEIIRDRFGSDHPHLVWMTRGLARCRQRAGDLGAAELTIEESLKIARAAYGDAHAELADSLVFLSFIQRDMGRIEASRETLRESLRVNRRVFGSSHSSLGIIQYDLACLSAIDNQPDRAVAELSEALDMGFANSVIFDDPDLVSLRGRRDFETICLEVRRRIESR